MGKFKTKAGKIIFGTVAIVVCGTAIFALGAVSGARHANSAVASSAESIAQATGSASTAEVSTETAVAAAQSAQAIEVKAADITINNDASWNDGTCGTYSVTIKSTEDVITDWKVVITFDTNVNVDALWNGEYTVDGNELTVTAAGYNEEINSQDGISFGFNAQFDNAPGEPTVVLYSQGYEVNTDGPLDTGGAAGSELINAVTSSPSTSTSTTSSGTTPVAANGQLYVKGTKIVNQNGQPFVIKGVSTHGIAWFPQYITKDGFQTLRDSMGVNTVRLALYSSSGEGYSTDLHKKVDEGVKYATELGMYVVIDWHILNNGNPNTDKAAAESFFKEMAGKYKDNNNVLYEICNEPNGDVQWERDIKPYAESMISVIRAIDNDAIVIVGTPTWSQDVDVAAKSPLSDKNTVYALHFYAATHKQDLRNKAQTAINAGLPLLVSEFGICDASGNGNIDETEANKWMEFLDNNSIGRICWNLSNKNESSSLIASSSQKTSGWTDADLSQSGKWLKKSYNK
jgi:endoglucanase